MQDSYMYVKTHWNVAIAQCCETFFIANRRCSHEEESYRRLLQYKLSLTSLFPRLLWLDSQVSLKNMKIECRSHCLIIICAKVVKSLAADLIDDTKGNNFLLRPFIIRSHVHFLHSCSDDYFVYVYVYLHGLDQ